MTAHKEQKKSSIDRYLIENPRIEWRKLDGVTFLKNGLIYDAEGIVIGMLSHEPNQFNPERMSSAQVAWAYLSSRES